MCPYEASFDHVNMHPVRADRSSLLALHAAVLLFGVAGLFGKLLPLSPLWIVFGRAAFAALSLGLFLLILGPEQKLTSARRKGERVVSAVLPGVVLAVHWVSFFQAIQDSTVAVGLLTYSSFPLFTTLMEPWAFGERLRRLDLLTALLVLIGLVVMVPSFDLGNRVTRGACWGTLSGLTFAMLSVLNRRLVREAPPVRLAFGQNAVAALVLLPLLFLLPSAVRAAPHGPKDVLLLAALGVCCTAIAHTLFIKGMSGARAQLASVVSALESVYGIVFAVLFLGEQPSSRTLTGGAIILAAVVLATLRSR